ncbi:MAG: DEAD/DEAH box helicase family protein [Pirellulales bacterium]|nr:DEAD/DEAH box helicase family protein [Pirellulales bacterium]
MGMQAHPQAGSISGAQPAPLLPGTCGQPFEPREYQQRIVARAVDLFCTQGVRSVLIDSPTGSGKTLMGLLIAREMMQRCGVRVGWVAMRRHLLAQAAAEERRFGLETGCAWISMFEKNPPGGITMLVVDEAQHDAAASMAHLHNTLRPRFILGLSATPFRSDRLKLCFNTVIRDAGIHRLIQDGYLSRFAHYTLPEYSPAAVVECYLHQPALWGKSIMYFHTLAQCRQACRLLAAAGARAELVHGSSDREEQLAAFAQGEVQVLVNCLLLGEGFDCADLGTVFCRPSGRGVAVQACGRVLRRHPAVPLKRVVQCRATRWPFTRTAAPHCQYVWEGGEWRSIEANRRVEAASARVMQALAAAEVTLPAYLTRQRSARR